MYHFPALRPDAAAQQTSQIATALGQLAHQQRVQYEEAKSEKEKAKNKTVEDWLGKARFNTLKNYLGVADEASLDICCPVYKEIANASKSDRLTTLQAAVNEELREMGHTHLTVTLSPGVFENFASMEWHRLDSDSVSTGFFGNFFLFGKTNEELQRELNTQLRLIQSGHNSVSHADAKDLLKLSVNLPTENKSIDVVKRVVVLTRVLLPVTHPFRIYLSRHLTAFDNFRDEWEAHELPDPRLQPAKGVLHLQHLSLRASAFWRDQATSQLPVRLPDPLDLITRISHSEPWVPTISSTLRINLKLDSLCRLSAPSAADDVSMMSGLTGATTGTSGQVALADILRQLAGSQSGGGGGGKNGGHGGGGAGGTPPPKNSNSVTNQAFNETLFGEVKVRKIDNKPIRSRDIRTKITRGDIPDLPPSKIDKHPMCLAWHTKGMCNPGCPRAVDHVPYSTSEYSPLVNWCSEHYPTVE